MDADKRHQLKTNELAAALQRLRDVGRDPTTRYWIIGVVAVVVLVGGYRLWGSVRVSQIANGWWELAQVTAQANQNPAGTAEGLRRVIADAPDRTLAAHARLRLAGTLRAQAHAQPTGGEALLREAIEILRGLCDDPATPRELVPPAAFSLGTSYESLRDFDSAAAAYRGIVADPRSAGTMFRELAEQRLATLDELRTPIAMAAGTRPPETQPATTPQMSPLTDPLMGPPIAPAPPTDQPLPPPVPQPQAPPPPATETQPAPAEPGLGTP